MPTAPPPPATGPVCLLDAAAIARTLAQMAQQIIERNAERGLATLALVGIYTRGVEVAWRLADLIGETTGTRPALGALDVSMHRDDLRRRVRLTSIQPTHLPIDMDTRTVVLVDDVFFTGRTVRAALDALGNYGRPGTIQLAALVDRGHRELPIRPDFTGQEVSTSFQDRVHVRFESCDGEPDAVWLAKPTSER